ncbi:MAG TPA: hypothetical protein VEW07_06385 [Solirubrobacterales bacterium]|nr:hypothetical protein [Solirubrobacterales bacterium]
MAEQDATEFVVYPNGNLYLAPFGTALPPKDDPTEALISAYHKVGLINDEGIGFTSGVETEDIKSWQSAVPTLKLVTGRSFGVNAGLQQINRENWSAVHGGGTWEETEPDVFRYEPPASDAALAEYVVVAEGYIGDKFSRTILPRAVTTAEVEYRYVRNAPIELPAAFEALQAPGFDIPWYKTSNAENFAEGS